MLGTDAGGRDDAFANSVGTTTTKAFETHAALAGLAGKDARALGYEVKSTTIKARNRAHHYPGGAPVQAKLTVEQLSQLDLAYMPFMSPVWEPLLVAGNVALKG